MNMVAFFVATLAACSALRAPGMGAIGNGAHSSHPTPTRRAALLSGAALAATAAMPALADDGAWAVHSGKFDDAFFSGFTASKADSNFVYKIVAPGEGDTAVNLQQVRMHYTGYLLDGTKFDSSYGSDVLGKEYEPFKFRVGKGKVIAGWEGLALGMRAGTKLIARIPAKFAYGDKSVGPIPPNSDLVFYMECTSLGNIKGDKPRVPDLSNM